jgi:DNA-binding transcriptional ArsR family regulator
LDAIFRALADASRRTMVERLTQGPATVSDLAHLFEASMPTVMQHLGVLEDAGIVRSEKQGRVRTYQLVPGALRPATDWMGLQRTPAERQLGRLADFLTPHPVKEQPQ